jgi:hypothetical protein
VGRAYTRTKVSPIVGDYGNVGPILSEQNLENVFRTEDSAPWYVSFNLTKEENVALGVLALPSSHFNYGPAFDLSFLRIVTFADGRRKKADNFIISKILSLILAAILSIGPGFVLPVFAQTHSYILDTNGKGLTELGTLGGNPVTPLPSVMPGRWWGTPPRLPVIGMLS